MLENFTYLGLSRTDLEGLLAIEAKSKPVENNSPLPKQSAQLTNGVAMVNVTGILFPRSNFFTIMGFGTDLSSVSTQLDNAASDPQIAKIILNMDSPGGVVTGVNELAGQIKAINKPVICYVGGMACSAAYWLASACDSIQCDGTALLGSIGVVATFQPKATDQIEIVSSNAPDKRPDAATDAGRVVILKTLDALESQFFASVTSFRPIMTQDKLKALRGDVAVGSKAVSLGLADSLGNLRSITAASPKTNGNIQMQHKQNQEPWANAIAKVFGATTSPVETANNKVMDIQHGWNRAKVKLGLIPKDTQTYSTAPIENSPVIVVNKADTMPLNQVQIQASWSAAKAKLGLLPSQCKATQMPPTISRKMAIEDTPILGSVTHQTDDDIQAGWKNAAAKGCRSYQNTCSGKMVISHHFKTVERCNLASSSRT